MHCKYIPNRNRRFQLHRKKLSGFWTVLKFANSIEDNNLECMAIPANRRSECTKLNEKKATMKKKKQWVDEVKRRDFGEMGDIQVISENRMSKLYQCEDEMRSGGKKKPPNYKLYIAVYVY